MNQELPLEIKMYRNVQAIAAKTIYQSTCHFLKIDDRDNPKPYASGVFVKIENNYFLLTAAHVIDDCEDEIYIGIKQEEPLLKLGGEWTKNIPETTREKDKILIFRQSRPGLMDFHKVYSPKYPLMSYLFYSFYHYFL